VPRLLDWPYGELEPELRKSFEVALHAGTAVALLIGLRHEVAQYLRDFSGRNLVTLALSFMPAAVIASRYERVIEDRLGEPVPVAIALIGGSAAMALADGCPQERERHETRPADAIVIGLAQACALAPGVSRNGATLAAARWRRFRRTDANVISRQIALPVIVGASILKGARLATRSDLPEGVGRGMLAGALAAFGSTLLSMRLIRVLERGRSLRPYAAYRAILGTLVLAGLRRRAGSSVSAPNRELEPSRVPTAVG
jgi:undecaprenyl-diphosphatase